MKLTKCAIALGSNLGDSLTILKNAVATLNNTPGITVKSHSSWYQTAPVGPPVLGAEVHHVGDDAGHVLDRVLLERVVELRELLIRN